MIIHNWLSRKTLLWQHFQITKHNPIGKVLTAQWLIFWKKRPVCMLNRIVINMYYIYERTTYLIRNILQNHTKTSNSWLHGLTYKMDFFSPKNQSLCTMKASIRSIMNGGHSLLYLYSFYLYLGTILILRQQREWLGGVKKMSIFADGQYNLWWLRVSVVLGGWVRKSLEIYWRDIGMVP